MAQLIFVFLTFFNIAILLCFLLFLEKKTMTFYEWVAMNPIDVETRWKQHSLEDVKNEPSFESLVNEQNLRQSEASLHFFWWYFTIVDRNSNIESVLSARYFSCLLEAFSYIDNNNLRERKRVKA